MSKAREVDVRVGDVVTAERLGRRVLVSAVDWQSRTVLYYEGGKPYTLFFEELRVLDHESRPDPTKPPTDPDDWTAGMPIEDLRAEARALRCALDSAKKELRKQEAELKSQDEKLTERAQHAMWLRDQLGITVGERDDAIRTRNVVEAENGRLRRELDKLRKAVKR